MKDDRLYLLHVGECIGRIADYVIGGKDEFLADTKTQDAVLRNLQVLAESSRRIPDRLKEQHPEVDWRGISGLRNVLVHDYLGVTLERIWEIVSRDLPGLKSAAQAMLAELEEDG